MLFFITFWACRIWVQDHFIFLLASHDFGVSEHKTVCSVSQCCILKVSSCLFIFWFGFFRSIGRVRFYFCKNRILHPEIMSDLMMCKHLDVFYFIFLYIFWWRRVSAIFDRNRWLIYLCYSWGLHFSRSNKPFLFSRFLAGSNFNFPRFYFSLGSTYFVAEGMCAHSRWPRRFFGVLVLALINDSFHFLLNWPWL